MCDSAATPDNTIPLPQPAAQPAHPSTEVHTKGIHAAPKAAAAAGTVPQLASLTGYPGRVVGCLLGKMCGDVLGAGYEGWDADRVRASAPAGAVDFPRTERGYGCYTDDTQMAVALARSLLACGGRIDSVHAALAYAQEYEPSRGYGGTAYKILQDIAREGVDHHGVVALATRYIPGGSFGNGGAMRIAPLALAYRHAPPEVLRDAVRSALLPTHAHPVAQDGALVVALAVGWAARRRRPEPTALPPHSLAPAGTGPGAEQGGGHGGSADSVAEPAAAGVSSPGPLASPGAPSSAEAAGVGDCGGPDALLAHLLAPTQRALYRTEGMARRLEVLREALQRAPHLKPASQPWSDYLAGPGWAAELGAVRQVSEPFQIRADDAAACALAATCWHWGCAEDGVVAAVHYGGDTDTVAAIAGALCGALHGAKWIPARWWCALENGRAGRDDVVELGLQLAGLDTRD